MFIFERGREGGRGGAEKAGDTESEAGSVSTEPHVGLKLTNHEIMTSDKIKSLTLNSMHHPGTHQFTFSN